MKVPSLFPRLLCVSGLMFLGLTLQAQIDPQLSILEPVEGQTFPPGAPITLRAAVSANAPGAWQLEFFEGDRRVAEAAPDGTAIWRDASDGSHTLQARATDAAGWMLKSEPVTFLVGPGSALPVVSVVADPAKTAEPCPTCRVAPAVFHITRTEPIREPLVIYLAVSGTAVSGVDYESLPARVEIPAGAPTVDLLLMAFDDDDSEDTETVVVELVDPPFDSVPTYQVSREAGRASALITDSDSPVEDTVVRVEAIDAIASETSILALVDPARFRVSRSGDVSRPLVVFYSVHGSATPGTDYTGAEAPLTIPAGEASATIDLQPLVDEWEEGMETVLIRLEPSALAHSRHTGLASGPAKRWRSFSIAGRTGPRTWSG